MRRKNNGHCAVAADIHSYWHDLAVCAQRPAGGHAILDQPKGLLKWQKVERHTCHGKYAIANGS